MCIRDSPATAVRISPGADPVGPDPGPYGGKQPAPYAGHFPGAGGRIFRTSHRHDLICPGRYLPGSGLYQPAQDH